MAAETDVSKLLPQGSPRVPAPERTRRNVVDKFRSPEFLSLLSILGDGTTDSQPFRIE
jgi:hypothetical protein